MSYKFVLLFVKNLYLSVVIANVKFIRHLIENIPMC
jgi:hypothetical protein